MRALSSLRRARIVVLRTNTPALTTDLRSIRRDGNERLELHDAVAAWCKIDGVTLSRHNSRLNPTAVRSANTRRVSRKSR